MKKVFVLIIIGLITACSGSKDTSLMTPDEYYQYAYSLYQNEDYEEALKEFQAILLQYSGTPVNDDAQYYLAMTHFKREEYLLAAYEFSKLITDIPASPYVSDAQYMLAESYYELSPPYQLDQTYTKKAIEEYQAFIDFFPLSPKVDTAEAKINKLNIKLAEKEFHAARIYEKMEYNRAALKYYQEVFETYHDTEFAPLALYRKIMLELDLEKKKDAINDISVFLSKYPDHEDAPELKETESLLLNGKV